MIIGGGVVGMNAAFIAIGMEADVFVFDTVDRPPARARHRASAAAPRPSTRRRSSIEEMLPRADLVIGAVLVHGARAPHVIKREQLGADEAAARCSSTSRSTRAAASRPRARRPTSDPTYEVDGVIHYCVANMPGAVPITSTYALTNATLPYVAGARRPRRRRGGRGGTRPAARASTSPAGTVTHPAVAEGVGMDYVPPEEALGAELEAPFARRAKWARSRQRVELSTRRNHGQVRSR